MSHPRRSRDEWRAHIARWRGSGLSGADYARLHDLNANTFAWWRSELREKRSALGPGSLTLVPVTTPRAEADRRPVEVALPGGVVVRVPDHVDPARVAGLVRALVNAC